MADFNRKPVLQRMQDNFFATDVYAEPIRLNFNGNQTFPSLMGAIVSWIVRLGIFLFAATRMLSIVAHQSESIITTVGQVDFAVQNVTNLETLKNYDFMIGFNRIFN